MELCALALANSLSIEERLDLKRHLQICKSCRKTYKEYAEIGEVGMAFLAGTYTLAEEAERWDNRELGNKVSSLIRNQKQRRVLPIRRSSSRLSWESVARLAKGRWAIASLAACLTLAVALGAYRAGERKNAVSRQLSPSMPLVQQSIAPNGNTYADIRAAKAAQIAKPQQQITSGQQEVARLRAQSSMAEMRVTELGNLISEREAKLREMADTRDNLSRRLDESEKAYQSLQVEFANLKNEHSRTLLRAASLESGINQLTSINRDQERQLKDDEQYLVSDRDIRELMGARKLYIADVFDVDSVSQTRKPFGRVFYTQEKSLVFYAFDLDHQPGVKNASVFQVWGQRDSEPNGESHPMNLGILYMDSESNRRWVLRSDDPKQLAEIDAVFVTVEPHGGSHKPTGKPLLYALLRKEANHP